MPTPDWDPLDPVHSADPTEIHAHLREKCPVAWSDGFGGFYALTRYEDVAKAALDHETFSNVKATLPELAPGRPLRRQGPRMEIDHRRDGNRDGAAAALSARLLAARDGRLLGADRHVGGTVQPMVMSLLHQVTPPHWHGEAVVMRLLMVNL